MNPRLVIRQLLFFTLFSSALPGQSVFYSCASVTKTYVVGAKLPPSGLFFKSANGAWQHVGFNHPFLVALDYDPADPETIYLAAGNGLFRAADGGRKWTLLTGSDITELRDVAVDRNAPGTIYFGYSHGIRVSHDKGASWQEIGASLHRKYTEALRVDREHAGVVLAGGEEGIFRTEDGGEHWRIAGAGGFQISRIEQSPVTACEWLATTQLGGLFASHDCGKTFESVGRLGVGINLNDVAFDPTSPNRIAVVGWEVGVAISEDNGRTWQLRNLGLPTTHVTTVIFDPLKPGRVYASVNAEGLYVSGDDGKNWSKDGLDGTVVKAMKFIPEVAR
ncbi:MAG TPA: YCF48-related protein [Bryobacteraceae bacterium]